MRKKSFVIVTTGFALLLFIIGASFSSVFPVKLVAAENLGSWVPTTTFPNPNPDLTNSPQCVIYNETMICMTEDSTNVYYASVSESGISPWNQTTTFPGTSDPSCATYGGFIYCVGGNGNPVDIRLNNSVYFAPITSSGVGRWRRTISYPINIIGTSCVISAGYMYCVGGDRTIGTLQTVFAAYAPVSSSGIGPWTSTTSYPLNISNEDCVSSGGYIFCTGGVNSDGPIITNATYYAPISSSGIGNWTQTTTYPVDVSPQSCTSSADYMYCLGTLTGLTDAVNYAPLSQSGVGNWTQTSTYPGDPDSCVASSTYIYCLGGYGSTYTDFDAYYSEINASSTSSQTISSNSSTLTATFNSTASSTSETNTSSSSAFLSTTSSASESTSTSDSPTLSSTSSSSSWSPTTSTTTTWTTSSVTNKTTTSTLTATSVLASTTSMTTGAGSSSLPQTSSDSSAISSSMLSSTNPSLSSVNSTSSSSSPVPSSAFPQTATSSSSNPPSSSSTSQTNSMVELISLEIIGVIVVVIIVSGLALLWLRKH